MAGDAWRGHQVPTRLGPGSRIADYVLEEQIGAGGMAVVFRARDEVLGRLAAVKVLSPPLAADQDFRDPVPARVPGHRRGRRAAHPPGLRGRRSRWGAVHRDPVRSRRRPLVAAAPQRRPAGAEPGGRLIVQVAAALDAAHPIGLVHRDVKPGNVLIETVPGRPEHAYLSDFGLTKAASGATGLTVTGMFSAPPTYCAPEQITGRPLDGRADQYALGCVAFSLLTGSVPITATRPSPPSSRTSTTPPAASGHAWPDCRPAVDAVLARALAKDPEARSPPAASSPRAAHGAAVGTAPGSTARRDLARRAYLAAYPEPTGVTSEPGCRQVPSVSRLPISRPSGGTIPLSPVRP